ncbi:MAG: hypothetical protein WCK05_13050 [Planctomycetota bacterium]
MRHFISYFAAAVWAATLAITWPVLNFNVETIFGVLVFSAILAAVAIPVAIAAENEARQLAAKAKGKVR